MSVRILVVDDDPTIRHGVSTVLGQAGYRITEATSGEEALAAFRAEPFSIVITDIVMGTMSGLDLLHQIRLLDPEVLLIVITSHASLETATAALRAGAHDYLTKPLDLSQVVAMTRQAVEKLDLLREKRETVERMKRGAEELEDLNRRLTEMAVRDGLTGLYNHRHFRESLEIEVQRSQRHDHVFSLIFLDVDHFKTLNDTHGHLQGDRTLRTLAQVVQKRSRASTLVARYGGEEFILIAPETGAEGARIFAESLRRLVEEHPFEGGRVTLSLGVATFPEDGTDGASLIAAADRALYQAKNSGRNRVCSARESAVLVPDRG